MRTSELKREILELIERDREFRYALMGLLGFKELLDRFTRLEERQQRLEERQQRLEERFVLVEEELRETRRVVTVIAHRFGVISEEGFRQALKHVIEGILGVGVVERKSLKDETGLVYGHPAVVEVDVVIRDKSHVLVEIKSRVSRGDVAELYRIGKLYEEQTGVKPRLLIVGGFVDSDARITASELGVEIHPIIREQQ